MGAELAVDPWTDRLGGFIERHPKLAIKIAGWETSALSEKLAEIPITAPIYVTGLARSGTTILLEILSRHPDLASHRYRDFPAVLTPYLWNWFVDRAAKPQQAPGERAHKDRIKVTPESPEAFEEVVWMAFFDGLHDGTGDALLDRATDNPAFEAFYRDHIRKMLLIRGGTRYVAKANYNVTRLPYLLKLFPDARFVVPIRDPVWHIASLVKQHELFCSAQRADERVLRHFRRAGHFEFGLARRALALRGRGGAEIEALWESGNEIAGWAALWDLVYGGLAQMLDQDAALREATLVTRYEDFCAAPGSSMRAILHHCGLQPHDLPETAEAMISPPDYYAPKFSETELAEIAARTGETARHFGYSVAGDVTQATSAASPMEPTAARRQGPDDTGSDQ